MDFLELLIIAIGLAMDSFAVSVGKGLSVKSLTWRQYVCVGAWFGGFQGLMPIIGFFAGAWFTSYVTSVDHWIAFALLFLIGANMIKESFSPTEEQGHKNADFGAKTMFLMAVATSIDALAVGISFAFMKVNIAVAASVIAAVTFVLSAAGLKIGNVFGSRYTRKAEFAGGLILILIGLKILLSHVINGAA